MKSASDRAREVSEPVRRLRRWGRVAFGDRLGLVLWLGLLAWFALLWRLDLAVTDSNVFANMLVSLADGNLAVTEIRFPLDTVGSQRVQQGLRAHEGAYYGRNYGQVALAVPVLWGLRALSALVDLRLLLAGGWSLLLIVLVTQVGILRDRARIGRYVGVAVGSIVFLASLGVATDVDGRLLPVVAIQFTNVLAAAGIGVVLYRIVGRFHGRRVGLAAGIAAGVATPVAFWATFPKRHVLVALLALVGILAFTTSRRESIDDRNRLLARAGAYAAMGLVAWIHAAEGFLLVVALAAVDLPTAEQTGPRELAVLATALALSLVPTVATNVAITGNPAIPPRMVGEWARWEDILDGIATSPGSLATAGTALAGFAPAITAASVAVLDAVSSLFDRLVGVLGGGLAAMTDPERLWHTFVRSGNFEHLLPSGVPYQPIDLSVMESMPLLAGLLALPLVALRRGRRLVGTRGGPAIGSLSAARQTDLLVVAVASVFTVVYLSRLPLNAQLTVRYLLVFFPLGVYGLARLPPVRNPIEGEPGWAAGGAAVGLAAVVIGGPFLLASLGPARAEAVQAHALFHLALALGLGAAVLARATVPNRVAPQWVATATGGTAGVTAGYYVLAGLEYFTDGRYALDLARVAAELVSIL